MITRFPVATAFPELFDDTGRLWRQVDSLVKRSNGTVRSFAVDLRELNDHYLILADVPGLSRDKIDLTRDGSDLVIAVAACSECDVEAESNDKTGKVLHRERPTLVGKRVVRLPDDAGDVSEAKLDAGILSVKISKKPELQPRKIEIQ